MKKNKDFLGPYKINNIYYGDAQNLIKKIPSLSVDLILTDPPFAIEFKPIKSNYNRKKEHVIEGYNEIPKENYFDFMYGWLKEAYRILKVTGSLYVFSGWNNLKDVLNAIEKANFFVLNHLIWKFQFGVYTKRKFVTSHYHILLCIKDKKRYKFNKIEHYPEDVIYVKREYWNGKIKTPTKLPLELVSKLILYSSDKSDIIFDPFVGSGTTCVAAKLTGRKFLGFEIVPEYVEIAKKRLEGESYLKIKNEDEFQLKFTDLIKV